MLVKEGTLWTKAVPRAWFENFDNLFLNCGFTRTVSDCSVKSSDAGCVILVVYVDDIVLSGNDKLGIEESKKWLASQVHIKNLGDLKYFLGIEVIRNGKGILLNQKKYDENLLIETKCGASKGDRHTT